MLKFLQNTGLTDIRFIIINSQQTASDFNSLLELVKDSGIQVYQETKHEPIWRKLEGGKDDMFVYDRCGRLTYYVPYPLSGLHDVPIVHTTLLSSYFDYPCGKICSNKSTTSLPSILSALSKSSSATNSKYHSSIGTNAVMYTKPSSNILESDSGKKMVLSSSSNSSRQPKDQLIDEFDGSGSGSGESPIIQLPTVSNYDTFASILSAAASSSPILTPTTVKPKVTINLLTSVNLNETHSVSVPSSLPSASPSILPHSSPHSPSSIEPFGVRSVWKIWQFFVGGTGNESGPVSSGNENLPSTSGSSGSSTSITSSLSSLRKRPLTFNNNTNNISNNNSSNASSATHEVWLLNGKRCNGFDKSVCVDISVSKLLRARLCCLNEITGGLMGAGKGFRCAGYTKSICNKMFPLIKCCLKDFHLILGKYLNNNSSHSPSYNIG